MPEPSKNQVPRYLNCPQDNEQVIHDLSAYSLSEPDLIAEAKAGNLSAFDALMIKHEKQVFHTAYRMLGNVEDAKDVAQEVFLRLYKYLSNVDDVTTFSRWLYRIVINVSKDYLSKNRRPHVLSLDSELDKNPSLKFTVTAEARRSKDDGRHSELSDLREEIKACMNTLTKNEKAAFVLRDLEELSVKEAAEIMDCSESTVRSHCCRARVKVRKRLRQRQAFLGLEDKDDS